MTDGNIPRAPDATAPQALLAQSFSWSRFAERGIIAACVPIPAYATQNQRACAIRKSRPQITSRRIKWRNSLWSRRFWCPSFRLPAHGRPRNRFSISSRFRPRSMSNPCRAREDTNLFPQRQDQRPASDLWQPCQERRTASISRLIPPSVSGRLSILQSHVADCAANPRVQRDPGRFREFPVPEMPATFRAPLASGVIGAVRPARFGRSHRSVCLVKMIAGQSC